ADELVDVRRRPRGHDFAHRRAFLAVSDVVADRPGEQPGVLQDHAERAPDDVAWQLARIDAVEADRAAIDLVEAHEQIDDGRLAGARRANDRDRLSRRNIEAEVLDERLLG